MRKYMTWTSGVAMLRTAADKDDNVYEMISEIQSTGAKVIMVEKLMIIGTLKCDLDDAIKMAEQGWNWK